MAAADHWWGFVLVCVGFLAALGGITYRELRRKDSTADDIDPVRRAVRIVLSQALFYVFYIVLLLATDSAAMQPLWFTQIFHAREYTFWTVRGWVTWATMVLAYLLHTVTLVVLVRKSKQMLDYAVTLTLLHFVVVSAATNDFPATGAWWVAAVVGTVALSTLSELVSYRLETMEFKVSFVDRVKEEARRKAKAEREEREEREARGAHEKGGGGGDTHGAVELSSLGRSVHSLQEWEDVHGSAA